MLLIFALSRVCSINFRVDGDIQITPAVKLLTDCLGADGADHRPTIQVGRIGGLESHVLLCPGPELLTMLLLSFNEVQTSEWSETIAMNLGIDASGTA
jgi:hypothetical protein